MEKRIYIKQPQAPHETWAAYFSDQRLFLGKTAFHEQANKTDLSEYTIFVDDTELTQEEKINFLYDFTSIQNLQQ